MIRVYVVVSYIESSDGSMRMRTLDGYTTILKLAELYVDTHLGTYRIMTYEGQCETDIFSEIYEEYGYAVDSDVELKIKMLTSYDGLYSIVDTPENINNLLYEIGMFDEICQDSITSYLSMMNIFKYSRDNTFEIILRYLASKYFGSFVNWMQNCDDFGYQEDYTKYPIDIVSALVVAGYLKPVEHIKGDSKYDFN